MAINTNDFDYIRDLVRERAAITLEAGKEYLVEARLVPLARREGVASVAELVARLRAEQFNHLHRRVVEAMTTNETSFFRDLYPFEALKKEVLPNLLARRGGNDPINIWCAACSSGQEPYSIAMLLREHFPSLVNKVWLMASDLSSEMLARAREGRYSQLEANRGLPASLLVKYFHQQGTEWRIKEEIRRMVEFRQINLADPWPSLPELDIILLRNVLIYFNVEAKKDILGKVRQLLRSDGHLFLGGAESTMNLDNAFQRVQLDRAGCYRLLGG